MINAARATEVAALLRAEYDVTPTVTGFAGIAMAISPSP